MIHDTTATATACLRKRFRSAPGMEPGYGGGSWVLGSSARVQPVAAN